MCCSSLINYCDVYRLKYCFKILHFKKFTHFEKNYFKDVLKLLFFMETKNNNIEKR